MMPTRRRLAREISQLRTEVAEMREHLEALQSMQIRAIAHDLFNRTSAHGKPLEKVLNVDPIRIAQPIIGTRLYDAPKWRYEDWYRTDPIDDEIDDEGLDD